MFPGRRVVRRGGFLRGPEGLERRDTPAVGWQDLAALPDRPATGTAYIHPNHFRAFELDDAAMRSALAAAPADGGRIGPDALVLALPGPDGREQLFAVVNAPIMEPALAAEFPDIQTYRGQGLDDPTATLRLDLTPLGLHAQVLAAAGAWYIDPFTIPNSGPHLSYYRSDLSPDDVYPVAADGTVGPVDRGPTGDTDVVALTDGQLPAPDGFPQWLAAVAATFGPEVGGGDTRDGEDPGGTASRSGTVLRTYRAAVAADGEYTAVFGGTVALGQASIVTAMNRVSGVYETELSIRMVLVANNSSIVYTNAATDPYTNTSPSTLLSQNQSNLDAVIGTANYDIGHVFTTGGGGLAGLGVVGRAGVKAQGETGLPNPVGDAFYIDYVAHEMGHQFGGAHTFNGVNGNAAGNRTTSSAYEPGSGSTLQAYAGICGADDLQTNSDPYFHSRSFDQMIAYVDGTIPGVGTRTATGNTVPAVNAGLDYTVPALTPFVLTAAGSDADGDALTYCWEERDLGAAQALSAADNGASPIFRSFSGTTDPSRTFPRLSNLVNGTLAVGEKFPALARTAMTFRVTARDNRSGGGGVNTDDMVVRVVATGSAFAVTAPNTAVTWTGTTTQTVTWDVGRHHRRPDQRGQREHLLVHRRRADVPDHPGRRGAQQRDGDRHRAEHQQHDGPGAGAGGPATSSSTSRT